MNMMKTNICLYHSKQGTLLDNILFTAPAATEEDAWEAARMVDLVEDIQRMPNGMNTYITEERRIDSHRCPPKRITGNLLLIYK